MINQSEWGQDFTIVVGSDFNFLPGFYALFNSALLNGFKGKFILAFDDKNLSLPFKFEHPQLEIIYYQGLGEEYGHSPKKLPLLDQLPDGKYLYLDADIVIERSCDSICSAIEDHIVFSAEPFQMYAQNDLLLINQQKLLNIKGNLPYLPYVNGGSIGFKLPRDSSYLKDWHDYSKKYLKGYTKFIEHPCLYFLEQDILNILIRSYYREGKEFVILSHTRVELAVHDYPSIQPIKTREFPYDPKGLSLFSLNLEQPYMVHGASCRRPWLKFYPDKIKLSWKRRLRKLLSFKKISFLDFYKTPTTYDRAWAYYCCTNKEILPIKISDWAEIHNFTEYKNKKWRKIHWLKD